MTPPMHERQIASRAQKAWDHARGCKTTPTECPTCRQQMAWFESLPLDVLAKVLAE